MAECHSIDFRSQLLDVSELDAGLSLNTRLGYQHAWSLFTRWCDAHGAVSLPATPETLRNWLADMLVDGRKVSTVEHRAAAVGHWHRLRNHPDPYTQQVRDLLARARRLRPQSIRRVKAIAIEDIQAISRLLQTKRTPIAARNRAILLVGFMSALRSANLSALTMADIEFTDRGLVLEIRREKQDQLGKKARSIGIPYGHRPETCAVKAMQEWLQYRGRDAGPVFVSCQSNRLRPLTPERFGGVVKRLVRMIGLDDSQFSSHSLRSGFVTATGEFGAGELLIASQSGHASMKTLQRYFRRQNLFARNACSVLPL
jgi:site-specific recombinase XerD